MGSDKEMEWAKGTESIKTELQMNNNDITGERSNIKHKIKWKVRAYFKEYIQKAGANKSKIQHLLEGRQNWYPLDRPDYMNELTRKEASNIFKARTRMLDVKDNFRNKYQNLACRACNAADETQQHVLEECEVLHLTGECKAFKEDIFQTHEDKLTTTAANIQNIMNQLENQAKT